MSPEKIKRIMVTGASGSLGRSVVRTLAARGFKVRGGCRHPENIPVIEGVEAVRFDYEDAASVEAMLSGMEGLLLVAPPLDVHAAAKLNPAIDRAKASGIRHIVLNSAMGMDKNEKAPLRIVERHLMESGVNYTILRPNFFMENFSRGFIAPMVAQGAIYLAAGDSKTSFISTADIADVVAVVFGENHYGQEYDLTGPAALSHAEVASAISMAAGKAVVYHDITEEQMMEAAREHGMPEEAVQYMALLFRAVSGGMAAELTDGVRKLTGKSPISFEEFARKNADAWK